MRESDGFGALGKDVADAFGPFEEDEGVRIGEHFFPAEVEEVFGGDAIGVDVVYK